MTRLRIGGLEMLVLAAEGPPLASEQDALDALGETYFEPADLMVVPATRLPDNFFVLSTGLAGAILQKFVNYGQRVAIVGDISEALARSAALRDFVREANAAGHVVFAPDMNALERCLVP